MSTNSERVWKKSYGPLAATVGPVDGGGEGVQGVGQAAARPRFKLNATAPCRRALNIAHARVIAWFAGRASVSRSMRAD